MTKILSSIVVIGAVVLALLGSRALSAQDKYTVKVPGGLAFSEFRGYEGWQVLATSQNDKLVAVILGNPVMIRRLPGRHSRQRQAFPQRRQDGEDPLEPGKEPILPGYDGAGHPARCRLHGEGQQEIRGQRRMGMGHVQIMTPPPIRSRPAPWTTSRRRRTMPSAGSRATR